MSKPFRLKLALLCTLTAILTGCAATSHPLQQDALPSVTSVPTVRVTQTATVTPIPIRVWVDPELPIAFRDAIPWSDPIQASGGADQADVQVTWETGGVKEGKTAYWIYALVAPFPTITDEVSSESIRSAWNGDSAEPFDGAPLLLSAETETVFEKLWGKPAQNAVQILPAQDLLDTAWAQRPGWAIVPFEELTPRWKVIQVDGVSPLDPALDESGYPLKATLGWSTTDGKEASGALADFQLPTNRHAGHLARVFMTGTTAMVRHMALRMEEKGVLYPADKIGDLLKSADLTHISNEVSFYTKCPPAKPLRASMRFCTSPSYMQVLKAIGADVIELTGNHLLDWGSDAFAETLKLYASENLAVYGGGWTQEQARQPYKVEVNGNKLAFIGCNPSGPSADWAGQDQPGSAQCDYDWIESQIRALREEGYLPIVTIQHIEVYDYKPTSAQRVISERMAKAGAVLISGSQSHFPQGFTFVGDTLVHYGLGNTFFDQMDFGSSRAFLDRNVFYEGHLISTELFTIKLQDYAQPRLMTPEERAALLKIVFSESGW
ncbi:bacterial capsule synthesis protein PGA_cap [Longilinea arvoryzae]|uniref:Bacterial capsule synthesis protein PGA_cap n=1 Tax=Longilinea arvoryzae TaxID=360412 RepID=A0A0S7BLC7_9CHLR|nr:CapA family protein [Longilinea arvoryzae]GAP14458.1 bacterial capsule synthesis protein PGA_cap [Longilinea arvoryzae]